MKRVAAKYSKPAILNRYREITGQPAIEWRDMLTDEVKKAAGMRMAAGAALSEMTGERFNPWTFCKWCREENITKYHPRRENDAINREIVRCVRRVNGFSEVRTLTSALKSAMRHTGNNMSAAAELIGVQRTTMEKKLIACGLDYLIQRRSRCSESGTPTWTGPIPADYGQRFIPDGRNPCAGCDVHLSGKSKNNTLCRDCASRQRYVAATCSGLDQACAWETNPTANEHRSPGYRKAF